MSAFTVTNTYVLRNYYSYDRNLVISNNRSEADTETLNYADSTALRRAVRDLADYDFENADSSDMEERIKAFIDSYNNTLSSCSGSTDSTVSKAYSKLKELLSTYSSDLANIGITQNSSGYLKLSSSAISNISGSTFATVLDKNSDFMKSVKTYATRISRHIDIAI